MLDTVLHFLGDTCILQWKKHSLKIRLILCNTDNKIIINNIIYIIDNIINNKITEIININNLNIILLTFNFFNEKQSWMDSFSYINNIVYIISQKN